MCTENTGETSEFVGPLVISNQNDFKCLFAVLKSTSRIHHVWKCAHTQGHILDLVIIQDHVKAVCIFSIV